MTATAPILDAARAAYAAGLTILPVEADGSKRPAVLEWGKFKSERPTQDQMRSWQWSRQAGLGLVAGPSGGHTESWDFDTADVFDAFCEGARAAGLGELLDRLLAGYSDKTPRGGRRILVRYPTDVEWRDVTLARRLSADGKPETLIELPTFAIVAPSDERVHLSRKAYERVSGNFDTIASYSKGERDALLRLARSFDEMPVKEVRREAPAGKSGTRPGDVYSSRTTWAEILEPHGWRAVYTRGDVTCWRRPDKRDGISATTNHGGSDLLYVFSSSAPCFEPERSYDKFGAYAALEHSGDYGAAARALAARGFGERRVPVNQTRSQDSHGASSSPAGGPASATPAGPVIVCLADVEPAEIGWVWPQRLARGKLTLLVGDPGVGKSTLVLDVASRITTGGEWPDGGRAPQGSIILLACEDGLADTIRPRVDRQGGNAGRVFVLEGVRDEHGQERHFCLDRDLPDLRTVIEQYRPVVLVIDPLSAYFGTERDSYRDTEVRSVLAPLVALAEDTGTAVLGLMHLTKSSQQKALYRALGSIAFTASARIVLAAGKDPDADRCLLMASKQNICRPSATLAYGIGADQRLSWEAEPVTGVHVDTVLSGAVQAPDSDRDEAVMFLRQLLVDGPMPQRDVESAGRGQGWTMPQLRRAMRRANVVSEKGGFRDGWLWRVTAPAQPIAGAEGDAKPPKMTLSHESVIFGESSPVSPLDSTAIPKVTAVSSSTSSSAPPSSSDDGWEEV